MVAVGARALGCATATASCRSASGGNDTCAASFEVIAAFLPASQACNLPTPRSIFELLALDSAGGAHRSNLLHLLDDGCDVHGAIVAKGCNRVDELVFELCRDRTA